jgi:hypothetical protein
MYKALTALLVLDYQASILIDETAEKAAIASLSQNPGDTSPLLPLGNELVFQFDSLGLNFTSTTKFIKMVQSSTEASFIRTLLNVLEVDYVTDGETLETGITQLPNGLKLNSNGQIILKNIEQYDFDYKSYEILHELYKALEIFLDSVEEFYADFYQQSILDFVDAPYNTYDDSQVTDRNILVYDTRAIDAEIVNIIDPIADQIIDETNREAVKLKYRTLRDTIQNFAMFNAVPRIETYIDDLLFCVNGSRKYDIAQNQELRALIVTEDIYGYNRRERAAEEVFFPFHNKAILDQFTKGLSFTW